MAPLSRTTLAAALGVGVLVVPGCGSGKKNLPSPLAAPPTAVDTSVRTINNGQQRVVVVGAFTNPRMPSVAWPDIGSGMSRALAQSILNQGKVDVWIDAGLSAKVQRIVAGPSAQQARDIRLIKSEHQDLRWVIVGRVTDFKLTTELPEEIVGDSSPQAIVALQFDVIDVDAHRVVISDHVLGTAPAGKTPAEELYAGIDFGSYVFWSTPLGQASSQALRETLKRLDDLLPGAELDVHIVKRIDARRVRLGGAKAPTLRVGSEYYVCYPPSANLEAALILDPATGRPVVAKIIDTRKDGADAVLRGIPPRDVSWDDLVLLRDPPRAVDTGQPSTVAVSSDGPDA